MRITLSTLAHELERAGWLERNGGEFRLAALLGKHLSAAGPNAHAGSAERHDTRAVVVGRNTRALKALACELEAPVIGAAQPNRGIEQRQSGTIERDADVVDFITATGMTRRPTGTAGSTATPPAATNSWSSCAFSTATTPTSPPMPREHH